MKHFEWEIVLMVYECTGVVFMETFYCMQNQMFRFNQFFKVYKVENELYFGKMANGLYSEEQYYASIIFGIIMNIIQKKIVMPRGMKKEKLLDEAIKNPPSFLSMKSNFSIKVSDIVSVKMREIMNDSVLFIKLKNGDVLELDLQSPLSLDEVQMIFDPIDVKYVTYYW